MAGNLVFTYGTLQAGERNYERFMADTKFITEARTLYPHYIMLQFESVTSPGKFSPGVIKSEAQGSHIIGQLFEVSDEAIIGLDVLEGVGVKYDREKVDLEGGQAAWMYLRRGQGSPNPSPHITFDGDTNSYRWREQRVPIL